LLNLSSSRQWQSRGLSVALRLIMHDTITVTPSLKSWWAEQFKLLLSWMLETPLPFVDDYSLCLMATYVEFVGPDELNIVQTAKNWVARDHYSLIRLADSQRMHPLFFNQTWKLMTLILTDQIWVRSQGIDINMRDLFYDDPLALHLPSTDLPSDRERAVIKALLNYDEFDATLRNARKVI
jgi:hypothetical protein